ncbi:MAG: hypothetical protein FJ110_07605 [Deltaproteobacteria bacterium]|nr:hypothetical protein [Deltaproteobacteria bacterium]
MRKRIILSGLAVSVLMLGFLLTSAHAQVPDLSVWNGTWHRLNVRETGSNYDGARMNRDNQNSVIYLQIHDQIGPILNATLYLREDLNWVPVPIEMNFIGGAPLDFIFHVEFQSTDAIGTLFIGFAGQLSGRMVGGILRSTSFKSLGGYVWEQEAVESWARGLSITGNLISGPPPGVIVPVNGSSM